MPTFFKTPADFRAWLEVHGSTRTETLVGFYKLGSGLPSMTWQESVDEALCMGWIDGVRARVDDQAYKIRFTPRKPSSTWSAINIGRVQALQAQGRMTQAGMDAFARRSEAKSRTYAYEQSKRAVLEPAQQAQFKKHKAAWVFFQAQPAGYRHQMAWRIISAKREETRQSRLAKLIEASAAGRRL